MYDFIPVVWQYTRARAMMSTHSSDVELGIR